MEDYDGLLTEEEKRQLETALKMDHVEIGEDLETGHRRSCYGREEFFLEEERSGVTVNGSKQNGNIEGKGLKEEKKGWFSWGKRNGKQENGKKTMVPPRNSLSVDGKVSDLLGDSNSRNLKKNGRVSPERGRRSVDVRPTDYKVEDYRKGKEKDGRKSVCIDATARRRRLTTGNDVGQEMSTRRV